MASQSLERFHVAQADPTSGFEAALSELRAGRKRGHWIWYVFPQLAGLGQSSTSHLYGLAGIEEAAEYLRDALLRSHLLTATLAVEEHVKQGRSLDALMASHLDALKLVSSLTLFERAAASLALEDGVDEGRELADAAERVLAAATSHGLPRCRYTLEHLG